MSFIDYFKAAFEIAKRAQSVELQSELMAMREDYNALHEKNIELQEKLKALEDGLRIVGTLEYRAPAYYRKLENGTEDGPFCQRCWDADRMLIRLHVTRHARTGGNLYHCGQCSLERARRRQD